MTSPVSRLLRDREVLAWALYDWANSAFATTIMAGFFPIFFKQYFNAGIDPTVSTYRLAICNSGASLFVLAAAPFIAAVADARSMRRRCLTLFTLLAVAASAGLAALGGGQWRAAGLLYALGVIGFHGALVFYDSFLPHLAQKHSAAAVSCLGYGMGYLGGGLLFLLNVLLYLHPEVLGITAAQAVKASFASVAVWWALFALPLLGFVKMARGAAEASGALFRSSLARLAATARAILRTKTLFIFLIAYWLYIDGVNTVVKMAVDYGVAIGLAPSDLITALLITQFVGFPSAVLFGTLGRRLGVRRSISAGLVVYLLVTLWAWRMQHAWEFYALAVVIGGVQGGVQALSRSFYSEMVPAEDSAQYFSFFNIVGKFAAILGPLLVGVTAAASGSPRLGILPLGLLFIAGLVLLQRAGKREADERPSA